MLPALLLIAATGAPASASEAAPPPPPPRGEIMVGLGLAGGASSWSGDAVGYGTLGLGLRLYGVITPFVHTRLGYGRIDQRLLTFLSVGLMGGFHATPRIYPRAYAAFVHQHEESMASVAEEPFGAVLGIGPGIRHRAGAQFGLGCDFTVYEKPKVKLTFGPDLTMAFLTYSSGPGFYGLVGVMFNGYFPVF